MLTEASTRSTRLARTLLPALIACITFVVGTPEAHAKYGFEVTPKVGKPTTTFTVTFRAPFAVDGANTDYFVEAVGPPACASVFDWTGRTVKGQRVVIHLTPEDDLLLPSRLHRRWCRGAYVGYVYYQAPLNRPDKLIGYFSVGVGRAPVNLAG